MMQKTRDGVVEMLQFYRISIVIVEMENVKFFFFFFNLIIFVFQYFRYFRP